MYLYATLIQRCNEGLDPRRVHYFLLLLIERKMPIVVCIAVLSETILPAMISNRYN